MNKKHYPKTERSKHDIRLDSRLLKFDEQETSLKN